MFTKILLKEPPPELNSETKEPPPGLNSEK